MRRRDSAQSRENDKLRALCRSNVGKQCVVFQVEYKPLLIE